MPSRPGEFHPEPLTDPDLTLSRHPARASGGLRSTPDCRPRRVLLHPSYSYAPPFGPAILVTQDPQRTSAGRKSCTAQVLTWSWPSGMLPSSWRWWRPNASQAIETARVHHATRRRCGRLAARGTRAAARAHAAHRLAHEFIPELSHSPESAQHGSSSERVATVTTLTASCYVAGLTASSRHRCEVATVSAGYFDSSTPSE
jgi:hypothetical protein